MIVLVVKKVYTVYSYNGYTTYNSKYLFRIKERKRVVQRVTNKIQFYNFQRTVTPIIKRDLQGKNAAIQRGKREEKIVEKGIELEDTVAALRTRFEDIKKSGRKLGVIELAVI